LYTILPPIVKAAFLRKKKQNKQNSTFAFIFAHQITDKK